MPIDALLKKYFTVVILGLVAMMAYFQASGTTELFGAALSVDEKLLASKPKKSAAVAALLAAQSAGRSKSAEPILARNPFDSVTGPLNAKPLEVPEDQGSQVDTSNPLAAPRCSSTRVSIVTESADPLWSIAALQGPGESKPAIRRAGDQIGNVEVAYIGFNPVEASPAVWMREGSSLCQALLFAPQPAAQPAAAPAAPTPAAAPPKRGGPSKVPDDIANKIQKISETEFNVDRSVVDKILENQAELMRSARIVPEQQAGKVVGIRMFGIRPDTLLGTLGFQNGDRLETINGFNMASPEKALEAYARLRTASNLNVKVNRRGQPMSIDFRIK
ncbi:MAG TPA: type II secretion system protein GspC [Polyangiaceae bacterium]|nr:type II secretion system protein GspC [Polyangiaceae bacterium]